METELGAAISLWERAMPLKTKRSCKNAFVYMVIEKLDPWWNLLSLLLLPQ